MEQRRFKRIPLILDAKIISNDGSYEGYTENVSIEGLKYLITSVVTVSKYFIPGNKIALAFKLPNGETLDLTCEIIWVSETPDSHKKICVGMKIIDPPREYKEFLEKCPYFDYY